MRMSCRLICSATMVLTAGLGPIVSFAAAEAGKPAAMPKLLVASFTKQAAFILEHGEITWQFSAPGACQDAWLLGDGNILLGGGNRVVVVRPADNKVVWEYNSPTGIPIEIHSVLPLPNGSVLIGEGGMKRLIEVGRNGKILKEIPMPHDGSDAHNMPRGIRKTAKGTYLACCPFLQAVIEFDDKGKVLRTINSETTKANPEVKWQNIHSVTMLKNGNLLIGTSYGSSFFEIDAKDKVVWTLTAKDLPKEIGLSYASGVCERENGNLVISAYSSAYPLFEVTREKKLVWKWQCDPKRSKETDIGHPTNVQVIK